MALVGQQGGRLMRRVNGAAKSWYGAESSRQLIVISPIVENSSEINATVYLRTRM